MTPPLLIAQSAGAGRMVMHIGLVAVVVLALIAVLLVRRRRNDVPPIDRLDSPVDRSGESTDEEHRR